MIIYIPKHFDVKELVTPDLYKKYGENCLQFFCPYALATLDQLREKFGPATVNDWAWGGGYTESGLRSFDFGGILNRSLHKFGKAFDVKFKNHTAEEVRQYIINNPDEFPYIVGLELDVSWLHFDTRNRKGNKGRLFLFKP